MLAVADIIASSKPRTVRWNIVWWFAAISCAFFAWTLAEIWVGDGYGSFPYFMGIVTGCMGMVLIQFKCLWHRK